MVRSKDPSLRRALLERVVDYALGHGVAELSLRPLAAEVGTSARMLIHHFGSKEQLVAEVLAAIEADLATRLVAQASDVDDLGVVLQRFWVQMSDPALESLLRSMFEVWGQALVRPEKYRTFLAGVVEPWTAFMAGRLVSRGLEPAQARDLALLIAATFQGLQLIRLTTGDAEAGARALTALTDRLIFRQGDPS